jgi:hypothetical protein
LSAQQLGEQERSDALVLSALMRASVRAVGVWSLGQSLFAVLVGAVFERSLAVTSLGALVLVCGVVERYYAFRLCLDERLFDQLGQGHLPNAHAMDASMVGLGLLRNQTLPERQWSDRLRGARNLLRRHLALVLLQTAAVIASLFIQGFA